MITRMLVGAIALLGPLGTVATAHADTKDSQFIQLLQNEGISDHISDSHAIDAAHTVCSKLTEGMTPTQVASDVLNSSLMPAYHSGYFVGAAIEVYCPEFDNEVPKS